MGYQDNSGFYHDYQAYVPISVNEFREVSSAGAVGATAAGAGVLSADTSPIMGAAATSEAMRLHWAAANADIVQCSIVLPPDFDGRDDVHVDLYVATDNTGGGGIEAATFSVLTSWDNAAQVTDTATDSVPATTVHKITATISHADIPDGASFVNIQLVPGTHANDPTQLFAARLRYTPRAVSA